MTTEVLQEFDFTQSSLCENLFAEDIGDFLDGHSFSGLSIGRGALKLVSEIAEKTHSCHTRRYHMHLDPALLSQYISHQR